jgi:D-glycero-alpha-D-manno-heptose-7-phosphate kinase
MIISRTPLRVSFIGGGSDLPAYYRNYGGRVVSMAVNKYVYVSVNKSFSNNVRVAYSTVEEHDTFCKVNHPLVRNSARLLGFQTGLEITSTADIPAKGTGLGSSSAYTVGLLNALSNYRGIGRSKSELAEFACQVEIEMCQEPIGKQDQYAASFGGLNIFSFEAGGSVKQDALDIDPFNMNEFLKSVLVFYTGITRSAASVLGDQVGNTQSGSKDHILREMVELVSPFAEALISGDIDQCGQILDANWKLKKELSNKISNDIIDEIYDEAIAAGAVGGKLLGAGAGGFMMFIAPPSKHRSIANRLKKLKQQFWDIDRTGTSIIHQS